MSIDTAEGTVGDVSDEIVKELKRQNTLLGKIELLGFMRLATLKMLSASYKVSQAWNKRNDQDEERA